MHLEKSGCGLWNPQRHPTYGLQALLEAVFGGKRLWRRLERGGSNYAGDGEEACRTVGLGGGVWGSPGLRQAFPEVPALTGSVLRVPEAKLPPQPP